MRRNVELLISCMGIQDYRILDMTNVQSDVLIIDQCEEDDLLETVYRGFRIRHLKCSERGLSRSRNRAIANAQGDIGLLCDDDERLVDGYPSIIASAYQALPDADIICFRIENRPRRHLKPRVHRINKWTAMSVGSWMISMDIARIRQSEVRFDVLLGAGSGNGAGEENKFLRDCLKAGLKVYYVPDNIGRVGEYHLESGKPQGSSWFVTFDGEYFYRRGATTRYILGLPVAIGDAFYYLASHDEVTQGGMSRKQALHHSLRGVFENPIGKQARETPQGCTTIRD